MSGYEGHTPGPTEEYITDDGITDMRMTPGPGWPKSEREQQLEARIESLLTRVEALETGLRRALALWDGKDEPGDFDRDVFDPLRQLLNNGNGEGTQGVRAE